MNKEASSSKTLNAKGLWLLCLMLGLSFASVFLTMWQMDRAAWPTEYSYAWVAYFAFAIMFPVMTSHLHAIWLSRKISWLTWWFCISNATVLGFWVYARIRADNINIDEEQTISWFFACTLGGPIGGFIVFGLIRRFAPSWIGFHKPETPRKKRSLSLRTMFFWLTPVGVLLGAMVNPEAFKFVTNEEPPFPV